VQEATRTCRAIANTAFLDGLTGEQPKVTYPVLPPSVGGTPQPQP